MRKVIVPSSLLLASLAFLYNVKNCGAASGVPLYASLLPGTAGNEYICRVRCSALCNQSILAPRTGTSNARRLIKGIESEQFSSPDGTWQLWNPTCEHKMIAHEFANRFDARRGLHTDIVGDVYKNRHLTADHSCWLQGTPRQLFCYHQNSRKTQVYLQGADYRRHTACTS